MRLQRSISFQSCNQGLSEEFLAKVLKPQSLKWGDYKSSIYFWNIYFFSIKYFFSAPIFILILGCPSSRNISECNPSFGGFQGCMQLISIGNKAVDMISIQQNGFGNFSDLQIDLCGITDRWENNVYSLIYLCLCFVSNGDLMTKNKTQNDMLFLLWEFRSPE